MFLRMMISFHGLLAGLLTIDFMLYYVCICVFDGQIIL